ncbi:MAG: dienelactone hydrolase family protein [Bacteroidia bacterium]|nr:dienelactone hydrolase family protein [Bacteroidia bacterium]
MKGTLLFFALVGFSFGLWAQDYALAQLENSSRHQEWVEVKYGDRVVHCFLVYPEVAENVPVVIVIHENRGLNDWARSFADQVAGAGYIAIAPDLLSGAGPNGGKTADFANADDARTALYELKPEQVTADLRAVELYARSLSAGNGKTATIGFCWGGSQCFNFATNNENIKAAMVFYGTGPQNAEDYARIKAPVYGFYGGNDNRVNSTIDASTTNMKAGSKFYEPVIYPGAGHAYMRSGDDPALSAEDPNKAARNASWERLKTILAGL